MKYFPVSRRDLRKGYKVLEAERKRAVLGMETKLEEIYKFSKKMEPIIEEINSTTAPRDVLQKCRDLLNDQNPENRILGIMTISNSNIPNTVLNGLPSILDKFYTEPDEKVKTQILCSIENCFDFLNNNTDHIGKELKKLIKINYREIKKVLRAAYKDKNDLVKVIGIHMMGVISDPIFINRIRKEMWTNKNSVIRNKAANAISDIIGRNNISMLTERTSAYSEFKRLYYEDSELKEALVNILTDIALDSDDPEVKRDLIDMFLESGQPLELSEDLSYTMRDNICLLRENIDKDMTER